ncbi:MAG: protein-ADP-ribose hydrolase [Lachnospiraceae bacterium]|nr:protein-ADP-ribose hydrolase [Lachnospiraceae bacterium]
MNQKERRKYLIRELLQENVQYRNMEIPAGEAEQKQLLRGLMNVRPPKRIGREFLKVQDAYLQEETAAKGITELDDLEPISEGLYLWQGDITTLRCDAIVNAANSGMTGCYVPNHRCIDNCIHSFSGIQLRVDCAKIMQMQGHEEKTGKAKITKAYNLPCRYILHTVGPIIGGTLTKTDCGLLAGCYRSCLELAVKNDLKSVAFCCISTGEFHFPNDKAAQIAVSTVREFMQKETSVKRVVFNVFKDLDEEIYGRLL